MKSIIFKEVTPLSDRDCFTVFSRKKMEFAYPVHIHDEYELNYIENAKGAKRVVGDSVEEIDDIELTLITSSNLSHAWLNHKNDRTRELKEITVQFHADLLNDQLLSRNQFKSIKDMFDNAIYGITFSKETIELVKLRLFSIASEKKGLHSVLQLIAILYDLSLSTNMRMLSSHSFREDEQVMFDSRRIEKAYKYMLENYEKQLRLSEIAALVNMSEVAFSRFIKKRTGKNFVDALNDIRLGHASRMLVDTTHSVSEICFSCGFNNISNFNKMFKKKKKCTPREFRENYWGDRILL